MAINGITGSQNTDAYSSPEKINLGDVYKAEKLSEILSGINNAIDNIEQDGVTNEEKGVLSKWLEKATGLFKAADGVRTTAHANFAQSMSGLIDRIKHAINPEEPNETDAQRPKQQTPVDLKQMSNNDIIAETEIIKLNLHLEGEMKRDYESCFTNIWGSGHKISQNDYGMIKSNLVKFQAKYTKELHNNNSFEKIDNYGKIETQISYYEELAERDTQENKNLGTHAYIPKKPTAEQVQAALTPEGRDPRQDWAQIGWGGNIQQ